MKDFSISSRLSAGPLWTVQEVAEYLNTSRDAVYMLVHRRKIPVIRRGRNLRFDPTTIISWLDSFREKAA